MGLCIYLVKQDLTPPKKKKKKKKKIPISVITGIQSIQLYSKLTTLKWEGAIDSEKFGLMTTNDLQP